MTSPKISEGVMSEMITLHPLHLINLHLLIRIKLKLFS